MSFFHLHTHSMYSVLDGMPQISDMVAKAKRNKQPGLGLTDHGVMSGAAELYAECKEAGIKPFPGEEFYVVKDVNDKEGKRYHLGLLALNTPAYQALLDLSSLSHDRDRYYYRPRVDFSDLAEMASDPEVADGIIALTGCWFGLVQQAILDAVQGNKSHGKKAKSVGTAVGTMMVEMLQDWFPYTYVEFQSHDVGKQDGLTEDEMLDILSEVSYQTGAPIVATQDAHYVRMKDQPVHDMMKQIAYIGSDDAGFPGDSYHLSSSTWVKEHHTEAVWESTIKVCEDLLDRHDLSIPVLDSYSYYVPKIGSDPQKWLRNTTKAKLMKSKMGKRNSYVGRLNHELSVIEGLGMAGYFRLIYEGIEFCKQKGIFVRARGSANGSLVCYLLGITTIDPIDWDLTFERFLSPDREHPPDIDLDIEDTRRDDVVEFYRQKFQVVQIGTYSTLGENEYGRGSVLVQYLSQKRRELGDDFKDELGHVKYMEDVPEDDRRLLHVLAQLKVKKAPGAHAAGFVVGTKKRPIDKQIPTMLIPSSGSKVTQFTMDDIERLGYIKIDLLGQRTLTTLKRVLELIGRDPADGTNWIPLDDRHTMHQLRRGQTTGVFQLEGWTAAQGCREMKVKKTEDIVRVNALYRPATIKTGYKDLYLRNRSQLSSVSYPNHPAFNYHLGSTYGVAIFQEQVMNILRDMGVPYEELNAFLSALKLSNDKAVRARKIFADHRRKFLRICRKNWGMDKSDSIECWDAISGFAGYGFNRAHAASYGLLGYQMAYLKTHHPLEFMAALLETTSGTPKEEEYVREAKRMKLEIAGADVNRSGVVWRLDGDRIRRGLISLKGVGVKAATSIVASAPFDSMEDMIDRTDSRAVTGGKEWSKHRTLKGVMEALRKEGALRSLGVDPY